MRLLREKKRRIRADLTAELRERVTNQKAGNKADKGTVMSQGSRRTLQDKESGASSQEGLWDAQEQRKTLEASANRKARKRRRENGGEIAPESANQRRDFEKGSEAQKVGKEKWAIEH